MNSRMNLRSAPVASSIIRSMPVFPGDQLFPVSRRKAATISGCPIAKSMQPSHAGTMYSGVSAGRRSAIDNRPGVCDWSDTASSPEEPPQYDIPDDAAAECDTDGDPYI